jgi:hypothetical protein
MGTWQYVMVYEFGVIFGLGLGSFAACFLLRAFFFNFFSLSFFPLAVGLLFAISPVLFFLFAFCFLESRLSCIASLSYALFILILSPLLLKTGLLTRKEHNFMGFAYV